MEKTKALSVKVDTTPGLPTYYTNNAEALSSVWDIRLELRQIREIDKENKMMVAEPVCVIITSWPHAKALAQLLSRLVENYEKNVGPIVTTRAEAEPPTTSE